MIWFLFSLILAGATPLPPAPHTWAIPTQIEVVGMVERTRNSVLTLLMGAVDLADVYAPVAPNLFHWRGPRDRTKSLRLVLLDSRKLDAVPDFAHLDPRARSAAFVTDDGRGYSRITVVLMIDRLVFNADHQLNLDGYAHLTLELVRHVFGLVQTYLERPVIVTDHAGEPVPEGFTLDLLYAFTDHLITSPAFTLMQPTMREGFIRAHAAVAKQLAGECELTLTAKGQQPGHPTSH